MTNTCPVILMELCCILSRNHPCFLHFGSTEWKYLFLVLIRIWNAFPPPLLIGILQWWLGIFEMLLILFSPYIRKTFWGFSRKFTIKCETMLLEENIRGNLFSIDLPKRLNFSYMKVVFFGISSQVEFTEMFINHNFKKTNMINLYIFYFI